MSSEEQHERTLEDLRSWVPAVSDGEIDPKSLIEAGDAATTVAGVVWNYLAQHPSRRAELAQDRVQAESRQGAFSTDSAESSALRIPDDLIVEAMLAKALEQTAPTNHELERQLERFLSQQPT